MTKRHFQMIAETLATMRPDREYEDDFYTWEGIRNAMADRFYKSFPDFDLADFINACGK